MEFCVKYIVHVYNRTPIARTKTTPYESVNRIKPDISHLHVMGCAAYVFLHEDQHQNKMSPHAKLMIFIGFTDGMKGWKFMRSTNAIFHATQVVFDESTFLHCPGSWASILAIETGVLNIDESNIPLEEFEVPQAPPAVEPIQSGSMVGDFHISPIISCLVLNYPQVIHPLILPLLV